MVSSKIPFRQKLGKETVIGTWLNAVRDPAIVRILADVGLDYLLIDMEHSSMDRSSVSEICLLAKQAGIYPMVRPTDPDNLKENARLLDAGAMGLVIPHIEDAEQARRIVGSIKYFGGGTRGYVSRSGASGYQKIGKQEMLLSDADITCVLQFESVKAIEEADEILSIDGVDVAIVGRGDLSHEMGYTAQTTHPEVERMVNTLYEAIERNHKVKGLLVQDVAEARKWVAKGLGFLTYSSEVGVLQSSYQRALRQIRGEE